jgi:hypothetical protein
VQQAASGVARLSSAASAAREKQKAEMLGKYFLSISRNGFV